MIQARIPVSILIKIKNGWKVKFNFVFVLFWFIQLLKQLFDLFVDVVDFYNFLG